MSSANGPERSERKPGISVNPFIQLLMNEEMCEALVDDLDKVEGPLNPAVGALYCQLKNALQENAGTAVV